MNRSRTYIATPPGATIKEQLEDRGMSQKEFAARMEMSEKHISHLINGDVQLTQGTANRLEMVLGIPASFWNNLESIYREKLAKVEEENQMDVEIELSKKFPYSNMASLGWIEDTNNRIDRVYNLRKFFEISKLGLVLRRDLMPHIACRRQNVTEKSDYALIAWSQKAKLDARNIIVSPINLQLLSERIPDIRRLTTKEPEVFCEALPRIMAECGIALVFLPHLNGSFLQAATFCDGNKIVVGVTVRGKDADKFWFSLFHEIGHIMLNHIHKEAVSGADEKAADDFAENNLIRKEHFCHFAYECNVSRESILKFAKENEIDPGIVVGRLQKKGIIEYQWYNDLKKKYMIST